MEKRKIESLRDLAIAHFPKARAKRAQAIRYNGNRFADCGLQSAYSWGEDGEATAIEKQASELLQLTFMHPDALPVDPHTWDAAKDAETIAIKSHTLEMALEMQPQLEAAMLSAARLLCELAGVALPPWVDAADAPAAKVEAGAVTTPKAGTNKKTWDDARLRALWEESIMPGVKITSLAKKHGVSRQRIGALIKTAKEKFSSMRAHSGRKNSYGQIIK